MYTFLVTTELPLVICTKQIPLLTFPKLIEALFTKTSIIPAGLKDDDDFKDNLITQMSLLEKLGVSAYLQQINQSFGERKY